MVNRLEPQIVGSYRYHDIILGRGNFATVYLARHKIIGCEVALKIINTDDIEEEYVFQNLERESQILQDLHHTNIIRLYEIIKSGNLYCLSLERIRGVTLYQYLMKQEKFKISEKLARIFFYQMLSAVRYMHRLQVIHRDLKLENILVEFGHVIKIIDFGLSNVYYPCVRLRTHCGSLEYAAPELFRSMSAYGLPVDAWSLGVILYVMLVGRMPFHYNGEKSKHGDSCHSREKFLQRISKGLTQENWELMEDLTPDCWKLLHGLLEPDQFRRLRIEEAIAHKWITNDKHLRERLPQNRKDLQRRFRPQIIEYLSDLLKASKMRIEMQINSRQFNRISSMFYIMRDLLVKEVLYPPKNFETTLLYRFECRKKNRTSLFPIYRHKEENENEERGNFNRKEEQETSKSLLTKTDKSSMKTKDADDPKLYSRAEVKDSIKSDFPSHEKPVRKAYSSLVTETDFDALSKEEQVVSCNRYRSYKNSRPVNIKRTAIGDTKQSENNDSKNDTKGKVFERKNASTYKQRSVREYKAKEKNCSKTHSENPTILTSSTPNKQQTTYTKSKISVNKTPKPAITEVRKLSSENIKPKANASLDGVTSAFKNAESQERKVVVVKRILKNPTKREVLPITTLNETQRPENTPNRTENSKRVTPTKTPSRIPIKNMRYGPPAPFSQSVNSEKTKKVTAADRISHSTGDGNGKVAQK